MLCSKCGTNLPDDAIACDRCATPISGSTVPHKKSTSPVVIVAVVVAAIIVVSILAFLGVGITGWQSAARTGNEAAAVQTMNSLRMFQAQHGARNRGNFGSFDQLGKVGLDRQFQGERPVVSGYAFTLVIEPPLGSRPAFFSISADPEAGSGTRHFYTDSSISVIKATDENRQARADDPPI